MVTQLHNSSLHRAVHNPSDYLYVALWPFTEFHVLPGDLYLSSDWWPALVAATIGAIVWLVDRRWR